MSLEPIDAKSYSAWDYLSDLYKELYGTRPHSLLKKLETEDDVLAVIEKLKNKKNRNKKDHTSYLSQQSIVESNKYSLKRILLEDVENPEALVSDKIVNKGVEDIVGFLNSKEGRDPSVRKFLSSRNKNKKINNKKIDLAKKNEKH